MFLDDEMKRKILKSYFTNEDNKFYFDKNETDDKASLGVCNQWSNQCKLFLIVM